jgi:hypothetical protein
LINRTTDTADPETIVDFFEGNENDGAGLSILEILYIVHILTAFPEFLIVSKYLTPDVGSVSSKSSKSSITPKTISLFPK